MERRRLHGIRPACGMGRLCGEDGGEERGVSFVPNGTGAAAFNQTTVRNGGLLSVVPMGLQRRGHFRASPNGAKLRNIQNGFWDRAHKSLITNE